MRTHRLTRRAAVGLALVLTASRALARPRRVLARPRAAGGIVVDVRPLRGNSGEPTAGWVAEELPGAIAAEFASQGEVPPPMSVRVDYVMLGPSSAVGLRGSVLDQMVGQITSRGTTRNLLAASFYVPSSVDAVMIEEANHTRVTLLSQAFADWIAKGY